MILGKLEKTTGKRYSMDSIRFKCHSCGKKLKSHKDNTGKKGTCPKCKTQNIIPEQEDIIAVVAELLKADDSGTHKDWTVK